MNQASPSENSAPGFALRAQYIKDLSFENPHAPASLMSVGDPPKVDMNVDLVAQRLQDNLYELGIIFTVRTTAERTLFIVDLTYAGIFVLNNIPEDKVEPLLLVDCAFLLYPFARRVIADVTRDSGFPPLMLEPIDFYRLYQERYGKNPNAA